MEQAQMKQQMEDLTVERELKYLMEVTLKMECELMAVVARE